MVNCGEKRHSQGIVVGFSYPLQGAELHNLPCSTSHECDLIAPNDLLALTSMDTDADAAAVAEQRANAVAKLRRAASLPRMKDGRRPPMHGEAGGLSEGERSQGDGKKDGDEEDSRCYARRQRDGGVCEC